MTIEKLAQPKSTRLSGSDSTSCSVCVRGIEQHEARQVRTALVRLHVDLAVVLAEAIRTAGLEDIAGIDLGESRRIDAQDLGVTLVGGANGEAKRAGVVEDPRGDALGVLAHESALTGRDADAIEIVPRLVAIVEADVHDVGVFLRHGVEDRANALGGGEVPRSGNVLASGGRRCRIDRVDVEVLVAELVLDEEDVLPIPAPEIPGDRTLRVVGDELGGGVRIAGALDPDVARVLVGLEEGGCRRPSGEICAPEISGLPKKSSRSMIGEDLPFAPRRRPAR